MNSDIKDLLIKKAMKSPCKFKIGAIGFDKVGNIVGIMTNIPYIDVKGGGYHAEMRLMRNTPRSLRTVIILRVNKRGKVKPIHPCPNCAREAQKRGVVIKSVME